MDIYELRLISKKKEYKEIYTFSFSSDRKIEFLAGQWVHLGFPSKDRDKSRVRHMSFASAPDDDCLEFTMDLASGSWFKNQMSLLKQGDIAKAFKISGDFVVKENSAKEIIFISGGIGITPVRAIVHHFKNRKIDLNWKLLHVSRDKFLYEAELNPLNNDQWRVDRAGIEDVWKEIIKDCSDRRYYVSGSDRFVTAMTEKLKESRIQTDRIVTENFDHQ